VTTAVYPGLAPCWSALAAGGPLLASPGWLAAMAGRLGPVPLTLTVAVAGEVRLAALASVQAVPAPGEFFDPYHLLVGPAPALPLTAAARAARAALAATAPGPDRFTPALVVMLPGYECVPVGPGAQRPELLDALVRQALRYGREHRLATVAFLYLRPEQRALAGALRRHDFVPVPLSLTWDLPVPPGGLAGYLAGRPRHRRQEARRELARLRDAGMSLDLPDPDDLTAATLSTMVTLRCALVRRYRGHADPAQQAARLAGLVRDVAGGRPRVVLATAGTDVLGFALFAPYREHWHCLAVGYDYADPRSRLAYFGTAYYAPLDPAAAAGVGWLGYGQGSAAAKRARGCTGTPLTGWVHCADPELAATVRAAAAVTALEPGAG